MLKAYTETSEFEVQKERKVKEQEWNKKKEKKISL